MDRDEKKKNAETLHEELKKARGIILSGFQGITVAQDFQSAQESCRDGRTIQGGEEQPDRARGQGDIRSSRLHKSWRERPPWP